MASGWNGKNRSSFAATASGPCVRSATRCRVLPRKPHAKGIEAQIESIPLPEGYSMTWEGEKSASSQSMKYLFKSYPLAVILMVAILIMLFKDYKKPGIIILCIPLMFVGVIFGMLLSGLTFNFVAIVATLGLVGMIIKNGIVLLDEITLQIASGAEPVKALLDSSASRFRPVMMASMTTILGMIPLLGDPLFGPGAVAIMGGLLIGTLITLLFVPVLYALFSISRNVRFVREDAKARREF